MARCLLIKAHAGVTADGANLVSAILKRAGHQVTMVLMPRGPFESYSEPELAQLDPLVAASDLVLVSVYSQHIERAAGLTARLRQRHPGKLVVWGGPHCINAAELSLRHADAVCYSEADEVIAPFVEKVAAGRDYLDTPNMAFRVGGRVVKNPALPPFTALDSLPYQDFDFAGYLRLGSALRPVTRGWFERALVNYPLWVKTYRAISSRGCPHTCTYCNNSRYISLFGHNRQRRRGVEDFVGELELAREQIPSLEMIAISDDDFFKRPRDQIEAFCTRYRERVGLPFSVAVSANSFATSKLEPLLDAGLRSLHMGVQTGSQRVLDEVYDRKISVRKTRRVIREVAGYQRSRELLLSLDFIVDNPYETGDDILRTYSYLVELPTHQIRINLFNLAFLPGSELYARAVEDGVISAAQEHARGFYSNTLQHQKNYATFLVHAIWLANVKGVRRHLPRAWLRALGSGPLARALSPVPDGMWSRLSLMTRRFGYHDYVKTIPVNAGTVKPGSRTPAARGSIPNEDRATV